MHSIDGIENPSKAAGHYSNIVEAIGQVLCADWFPSQQRNALKRRSFRRPAAIETAGLRVLIEARVRIDEMSLEQVRRWIWLVHCMSLMSAPQRNPHSTANDAKPGFVLHRIGCSEARLGRFLDARGEAFQKLLENAANQMSRSGLQVNWSKIVPLLLSSEEGASAENARIAICRDFLIASVRTSSTKGKTMVADDMAAMGHMS